MSATLYDVPSFRQLIDERWVAVALIYGPSRWAASHGVRLLRVVLTT